MSKQTGSFYGEAKRVVIVREDELSTHTRLESYGAQKYAANRRLSASSDDQG